LYRFLAITVLLDVKDIPQVGPLQRGRITGGFQRAGLVFCRDKTRINRHLDLSTAIFTRPEMTDCVLAHVRRALRCDQ
jgi:hypothetical protein